ncbi:DHA1 family bicyclomycin/chloramphenicol resistance-like MFS transporter [Shimia abyssi]|uniref:DHA1 family bicyclomycin/chloramphenicol resistance-like MFS transporter n=2 Tax=Shimia abyssi TaxID=1662395 RepID=A0A2P8FCP0_9RHOB|nr:DHA1 family bicyclomycin/chloramphenicol resistance-like MFS transporter [Shimia abyssi]
MSRPEFIAMCAMLFATIAFSIDAMLPALPEIGQELSPENLNRAQLILTSFVLGMGIGTFFTGPLSDRFGRKPVLIGGAMLYTVCAFVAWRSQTLETVLIARMVQGIGAAGPRIVTMAIIRDMFSGREMARIVSFAMMIFTIVPAFAPALGAVIIDFAGWRSIFVSFMVFSIITALWVAIRQPEPLAIENRRPFSLSRLIAAVSEMWAIPAVRISILVQSLIFGVLFAVISSVQQIYDISFEHGHDFHLWFAGVALISGSASFLNARLVMRLGMRYLITVTKGAQILFAAAMVLATMILPLGETLFYVFVFWQLTVFFSIGMTIGNLNALAMEPLGHMAGTAASVMGAIATIAGAAIAMPIGLAFDGTPLPLALSTTICSAFGFWLMLRMKHIEQGQATT